MSESCESSLTKSTNYQNHVSEHCCQIIDKKSACEKKEKCTSLDFFAVCSDLSMHESVVSAKEKIGVDTSPKTGAQATELRTPLAKKKGGLVSRRTGEGYL